MVFTIECPQCQRKLNVPETMLGLRVRCPSCAVEFEARASSEATPGVVSPPVPSSAPPSEPLDYDPDFGVPPERRKPHRGAAILTLGILGLSFSCCSPVGWVLGGAALSMASADLYEIEMGRMNREGQGMTQAGKVCGIVAIAVSFVTTPLGCVLGSIVGLH